MCTDRQRPGCQGAARVWGRAGFGRFEPVNEVEGTAEFYACSGVSGTWFVCERRMCVWQLTESDFMTVAKKEQWPINSKEKEKTLPA